MEWILIVAAIGMTCLTGYQLVKRTRRTNDNSEEYIPPPF
jgi:hypothetical protein